MAAKSRPREPPSAIERSGLYQAFEHALIQEFGFDGFAEFKKRAESSGSSARFADGFGGVFADVLDGGEAEANVVADGREVQAALVHVRRKHADAHAARFVDVLHHFFCVPRFGAEHGGHEFDWIVDFEIRGLVSEQRVGAGVGFGEAVAGRILP